MDKAAQLNEIHRQLEADVATLPLANQSIDIIPGEGNPDAELMFIGEAPGYHESVQRRPFVGRSGQFFRQTLEEVADISPEKVYISNIVKVRPPENRDPSPQEIAAFKSYLDQEINIIQPQIVVTLGRYSMSKFLPEVKISQVHGRLYTVKWEGQRLFVLPMFHPAAGLRHGKYKAAFVADFEKLSKILTWVKKNAAEYKLADNVKKALW